jgi:hypothetical protein
MSLRPLIVAFLLVSWCSAEDGNWIVLVAPGLKDAIKPLAVRREAEGWDVTVIEAEENPTAAMRRIAEMAGTGRPCCVLLAGDYWPAAGSNRTPAGVGLWLRMKGRPTDLPWAAGVKDPMIEVGRLPARNPAEAKIMVDKILAWPTEAAHLEAFPRAQLVAGHHGAPQSMATLANRLTNSLTLRLVKKLPPGWRFSGVSANDGSPWKVTAGDLTSMAKRMMTTRSTVLAYMGHSGPDGAVSGNSVFLTNDDWRALPPDGPRPGLFLTCGCYSCELAPQVEPYGFTAIRSPGGPPAVIGSHGETWASMGYLAAAGLIDRLTEEPAPVRVGSLWLGVQQGLSKGKISAATFAMLDMADGTQGKVPLAQQRQEHLESWMLLGDPAMPLLPPVLPIRINPPDAPVAGKPFRVSGSLPATLAGDSVRIHIETHPAAVRKLPGTAGKDGPKIQSVVVASADAVSVGTEFSANVELPEALPAGPWIVRVESLKSPVAGGIMQFGAMPGDQN